MVSVSELKQKISSMMEPSNYINNMMLPERVNATRHQPLGPDCVISSKEIIDQSILTTVQYYWYISHEKGCVECVVKKSLTGEVTTQDPKCVVTRKNRRFEAYCCTLCRQNFVTVVQALLHLKAVHRPSNRIVIQDRDVFDNIEKAMEVPPVPLPWHIAKKVGSDLGKPDENNGDLPPTFVIPPGAIPVNQSESLDDLPTMHQSSPLQDSPKPSKEKVQSSDTDQDSNPMLEIILALAKEFKKHIAALSFNDEEHEVNITFVDETKVVAKAPDLFVEPTEADGDESDEENTCLLLFVTEIEESKRDKNTEYVKLKANRPSLALKLLKEALKKGLAVSSRNSLENKQSSPNSNGKVSSSSDLDNNDQTSPLPSSIASCESKSRSGGNKMTKSVRFMLGAPDSSDDEENPSTPNVKSEESDEKKDGRNSEASFDGLKNVVDDLITTASKGRIISLPPTSPLTTSAPLHTFISSPSLPLVGSSPALSNMVSFNNQISIPRSSGTLTRNQSWTPSAAGTSFSVASIRRPYTARGFTYAEKIELMKQQNDYDAEFLNKHIRKTGNSTKTTNVQNNRSLPLEGTKHKVAEGMKKQRRNRKLGPGRKKHSSSSSDSDQPLTDRSSAEEGPKKPHRQHRNHSTDSDDAPPTLVKNVSSSASNFNDLLQNQLMAGVFSANEYYGSGEWATAAMETLKTLQSTMESRAHDELLNRNMSHDEKLTNHSHSGDEHKLVKGESLSDGDDYSPSHPLKVKFPSRKRCKSNETKPPLLEQDVKTKRAKKSDDEEKLDVETQRENIFTIAKHKYFDREILTSKHGVSPLLSQSEQTLVKNKNSIITSSSLGNKAGKPLPQLIREKSLMRNKSSSDSALSSSSRSPVALETSLSRIYEEPKKMHREWSEDKMFARSGEELVFVKDVSTQDVKDEILMKLKNNSSNTETGKPDQSMPEVFRNCVETYVKVQVIEKLRACKVCGFSVPVSDSHTPHSGDNSSDDVLRSHVMEHSLKELYETGYTIAQW